MDVWLRVSRNQALFLDHVQACNGQHKKSSDALKLFNKEPIPHMCMMLLARPIPRWAIIGRSRAKKQVNQKMFPSVYLLMDYYIEHVTTGL